ncbi:hypothetical protein AAUPMB_14975, partial [Pasteurella multocida subsp. multocida str. Anand1_buffalo]
FINAVSKLIKTFLKIQTNKKVKVTCLHEIAVSAFKF